MTTYDLDDHAGPLEGFLRIFGEMASETHGTGGQVCVYADGQLALDAAVGVDGVGRPVSTPSLFRTYCATKPALAFTLLRVMTEAAVPVDCPVGDIANVGNDIAPIPIGALLTHTSGLHHVHPIEGALLTGSARSQLLETVGPAPGWRVGEHQAYGEYLPFILVALLIEALTGTEYGRAVSGFLGSIGADADQVLVGACTQDVRREDIAVNVAMKADGGRLPLMLERSPTLGRADNASFGGLASARGLALLGERLRRMLSAGDSPWLDFATRRATEPRHDLVLDRECSFGHGVMVNLCQHSFADALSPDSFGHSGRAGMTSWFVDPPSRLAAAVHVNGLFQDNLTVNHARPRLLGALLRAVADAQ